MLYMLNAQEKSTEDTLSVVSVDTERSESVVSQEFGTTHASRFLKLEWLGQTIASLCWIASVFAYGITSPGDWLQLIAASCWLIANVAVIFPNRTD